MKRLVAMLLCVLIISMLAVPCYAAAWSEEKTGAVYAKYMDAITDVYKGKVSDGSATTTLPDSIAVTVSGNVDDSLTLVVKPVLQEETEAFGWFETCLHSVGTNIYPLDVYFVDGDGNKVQPRGDITVTIALPDGYKDPVVCFIDADGKVTVLDSSVGGGTISFTTNHNSYYAVVEKSTVPPNLSDSHSPQTGDNSDMMLWLVLLLVSGGVLTTTGITQKRKKNSVM